jgi:predicted N-acetyltransferase YhbS
MVGRAYEEERDFAAVTRMWREVGWIDDSDAQAEALRRVAARGGGIVADVRGEAECLVLRTPGTVRYLDVDLPLCAISGVTTSHIGRRQHLATDLIVETLTAAAEEGAAVAALGFFEQGFYDRFGFGTGSYEHRLRFDPASLDVPAPDRVPVRLGADEMAELHALMVRRHRGHGSVVLDPVDWFVAEWAWMDKPFALGWRSDDGRLTHALLGSMKDDHGPYVIEQLAYEELPQLLDILGWLRALGDQVNQVEIAAEPTEVQLQDLIRHPVRQRRIARLAGGSDSLHQAIAEQQDRILDLQACIAAVSVPEPVEFGLRLRDPLEHLGGWPGIGGEHTVHLGPTSSLEVGIGGGLPVLDASVGAFTRLWFGVRPASGLAISDDLAGPADLLAQLDRSLRLPTPQAGWPF